MKFCGNTNRSGFTLLELLVVVAILAIIAGALVVAYDGLETKSAEGVATYTIGALDSAIRTYRATNRDKYPNDFDSLMYSSAGDGKGVALAILPAKLQAKIGSYTLTQDGVAALADAGITSTRYVVSTANVEGESYRNDLTDNHEIPNRVFDELLAEGHGASVSLSVGVQVAAVETGNGTSVLIDSFANDGDAKTSGRLAEYFGLNANQGHVVIVFGVGNNSTLVGSGRNLRANGAVDPRSASLAQAPFYQKVNPTEYGRFLACFQIASDTNGNGTFDSNEFFTSRFLGVLDTHGDHYDEELAEFNGTKS